ncbi:hypothetical protein EK21DRAFT_107234 [Setomelanomma holmii]|uniref:Uncharacterized protein n=1 Tax=Setomelanomma holmii TaxID=210430 RepID=A0A9P4HIY7_9PLEO|nr:hypothetical protein EK21DRAFT_107234 [Setomelanomma holmii]
MAPSLSQPRIASHDFAYTVTNSESTSSSDTTIRPVPDSPQHTTETVCQSPPRLPRICVSAADLTSTTWDLTLSAHSELVTTPDSMPAVPLHRQCREDSDTTDHEDAIESSPTRTRATPPSTPTHSDAPPRHYPPVVPAKSSRRAAKTRAAPPSHSPPVPSNGTKKPAVLTTLSTLHIHPHTDEPLVPQIALRHPDQQDAYELPTSFYNPRLRSPRDTHDAPYW